MKENEKTEKGWSFDTDREKMRDFSEISKDDFLFSYSYVSEKEYEATKKALHDMNTTPRERYLQLCQIDYNKYKEAWEKEHSSNEFPSSFEEWLANEENEED